MILKEFLISPQSNLYRIVDLPLFYGEVATTIGVLQKISKSPKETFMERLKEELIKLELEGRWYISFLGTFDDIEIAERQLEFLHSLSPETFEFLVKCSQLYVDLPLINDGYNPPEEDLELYLSQATISLDLDPLQTGPHAIKVRCGDDLDRVCTLGSLYKECPELEGFGFPLSIYYLNVIFLEVVEGKWRWTKLQKQTKDGIVTYSKGLNNELVKAS